MLFSCFPIQHIELLMYTRGLRFITISLLLVVVVVVLYQITCLLMFDLLFADHLLAVLFADVFSSCNFSFDVTIMLFDQ